METIKLILELIYFISGPLLLVVAWKGLKQIIEARNQVEETKKSRVISSRREAFKIAAEKCEYYYSHIIPLQNILYKEIDNKKITFFENSEVVIEGDKILTKSKYANDEELELIWELPTLEVFNAMESFAIFFTSGIADEKVAFLTVGNTYCFSVIRYLPHLMMLSDKGSYKNILALFITWHNRIEKQKLEQEKEKIENKLSKTTEKTVKPIGTE
jgi:hypothetical protein